MENVVESMVGKIFKIIEKEDCDVMFFVGFFFRNVDNKSFKCVDELIILKFDVEVKGMNWVVREIFKVVVMGCNGNVFWGIFGGNVLMVGREGLNFVF